MIVTVMILSAFAPASVLAQGGDAGKRQSTAIAEMERVIEVLSFILCQPV